MKRSHEVTAKLMRAGSVAAGAALASAATVKMGGQNGYSIAGKVPLSLAMATLGYAASVFDIGGTYNSLLSGMADGCLAAYAAGIGRKIGAGDVHNLLQGTGERKYGELLDMSDPHRRAG